MNADEQTRHDEYIAKAEAAKTDAGAANYYQAAALLSDDANEWELAGEKFLAAGYQEEAVFCSKQANGG